MLSRVKWPGSRRPCREGALAWRLGVGAGWGKCDLGRGQGTSWRRSRETWWLSPGKEDTAGDEADEIGRKSRTPGGHWKLSRRSMSFYTLRPPPAACLEMDCRARRGWRREGLRRLSFEEELLCLPPGGQQRGGSCGLTWEGQGGRGERFR